MSELINQILYHEAKMLACKGIFARPSMPQPRKTRSEEVSNTCTASIFADIIPHCISWCNNEFAERDNKIAEMEPRSSLLLSNEKSNKNRFCTRSALTAFCWNWFYHEWKNKCYPCFRYSSAYFMLGYIKSSNLSGKCSSKYSSITFEAGMS